MIKISALLSLVLVFATICAAQTKPASRTRPAPAIVPIKSVVDPGKVVGLTYTNSTFGFEITFPDTWLIPDNDFEAEMKKSGIDVSLKVPAAIDPTAQRKLNDAARNVTLLLTAYRSMPGTPKNATVRISVEDLRSQPQVRDAVDYIDLMFQSLTLVKLPADFSYSETKAEQLGKKQFAFLDTAGRDEKTRAYATVRDRYAILFVITYSNDDDLQIFRKVLENGSFAMSGSDSKSRLKI